MTDKPNILFIMSDDHASHAISCYTRGDPMRPVINSTPNIDRIADRGMRFDNCFCTNGICTPSRATILTGTYNHVNGVTTLATMMDNSLLTFPKLLQSSGYQTCVVGKWHLGEGPRHCPAGFDYWNVLPGQGLYHDPVFIERPGVRKVIKGYATDLITDMAVKWLDQRDKSRPFYLSVHHKAPHRPWEPDEKHESLYASEEIPVPATFDDDYRTRSTAARVAKCRVDSDLTPEDLKLVPDPATGYMQRLGLPTAVDGYSLQPGEQDDPVTFGSQQDLRAWKYQRYIKDYLRCIASVDDNVGRLLDYLEREQLFDDTLVIYTSDQGFFLGDHGWFDKRFMYEESLRMPFVASFPREITPGTINKGIILNVDFAPTFLDLAGVPVPVSMQGQSFRQLMQGNTPRGWQSSMYYRYWMHRDTAHNIYAHYGVRTLSHKLIYYYNHPLMQPGANMPADPPEWELFDLEKDPYELNNVHGNPEYAGTVQELKKELERLQSKVGDIPFDPDDL